MSKYAIATFIVGWTEGFICYLIGYMVGITHDKRTITHECVKDTHDKGEPQYDFSEYADRLWKIAYERGKREALEQTEPTCSKMEQVDKDINVRSKDEPQTDCAWR